jgi:two-component system sensor histidine kinase YesM
MAELGRGNMQRVHYKSGIIEFDRLFEQFNNMKLKIQQLIYDVEQKEKQKHQMEIEKLAYQINPHFLLNTLNSIHWLAVLHEQPDIAKLIGTLNYLLNYNLGKSRECATLRSELKVLDAYLKLQQIRYNFKVYTNIEQGEYLDYPAAHFLLQPIAENAIRHGLDEHGKLEISTSYETQSHMVHIAISDNGKGIDEDLLASINENLKTNNGKRNGIGLRYVKSVLESYYGNGAKMEIQSVPAQGTKVLICLPVKGD